MSDLIIEGAKGIPDGLYVIKDGELFKYKPNRGTVYTVRSYHITEWSEGEWEKEDEYGDLWVCDQCGFASEYKDNFCPNCGCAMKGGEEE